jgi:5S rRNA maturation endonuclease (ribonuclease M5)
MSSAFTPPQHPKCGVPVHSYIYRNEHGEPVLVANRYEGRDGKFFLPFDVLQGEWKAPPARPLYNLNQIVNADPTQSVIFVEGEKCADALSGLGFLTTTSFGGCNALSKTDLAPLANRTVFIWPDYDEAGEKYAKALNIILCETGQKHSFQVPISTEMHRKVRKCPEKYTLSKGWDAADAVAEGWTHKDVENLLKSAEKQPFEKLPETTQNHVSLDNMELWHTPEKEAFASISIGGHVENWALESTHFRNFLSYQHYQIDGKMLSQTALEDKRRTLAGEALFSGTEHPVFTRIGHLDGCTYLDLGDKEWTTARIGPDGWEILKRPPIRFQRSRSMQALPFPDHGPNDINLLRPFLNVGSETDFRMVVGWLLGCFQSKGPYPILILTGEQGSAKSTTAKVLRSLIDPAQPMTRSAPQSEQDLVIAARHNHVLAFDNLSHIKPILADALCRIATGGGFGTRKLHTNTEEVLFDATRPVLLNGIPDLASRPDLADRSIIITLPVISETKRQFEDDFWQRFNTAAPSILAALLDATTTALARKSSVNLKERPRMADFAKWVSAAEPSLGWHEGAFAEAYSLNRQSVDTAAIEGNPVAEAIVSMVTDHGTWKGTATELSKALRSLYPLLTDDPLVFPRHPNKLSSELKRVQPLLRRKGIVFTKDRHGKSGQRVICIKNG